MKSKEAPFTYGTHECVFLWITVMLTCRCKLDPKGTLTHSICAFLPFSIKPLVHGCVSTFIHLTMGRDLATHSKPKMGALIWFPSVFVCQLTLLYFKSNTSLLVFKSILSPTGNQCKDIRNCLM